LKDIFWIGKSIYWTINEDARYKVTITINTDAKAAVVYFTPPTVRMYCSQCELIQPYNYITGENVLKDYEWSNEMDQRQGEPIHFTIFPAEKEYANDSQKKIEQVFMLVYQCQGCKGMPEAFLIRRIGMKFILSGRTPMEKVVVQTYIPKRQREFFSNAVIAYNAGQILPGLFMLRTFLEQFVRSRSATTLTTNIESLFDEYNASLPEDFKTRFPSLRMIYDRLSEDIHGANGSADLFNQAKEEIEHHFDARRLFKIAD
jgi:hypothetical protein